MKTKNSSVNFTIWRKWIANNKIYIYIWKEPKTIHNIVDVNSYNWVLSTSFHGKLLKYIFFYFSHQLSSHSAIIKPTLLRSYFALLILTLFMCRLVVVEKQHNCEHVTWYLQNGEVEWMNKKTKKKSWNFLQGSHCYGIANRLTWLLDFRFQQISDV